VGERTSVMCGSLGQLRKGAALTRSDPESLITRKRISAKEKGGPSSARNAAAVRPASTMANEIPLFVIHYSPSNSRPPELLRDLSSTNREHSATPK